MSAEPWPSDTAMPLRITRQIDAACDEFEAKLRIGGGVAIEPYLGGVEITGREILIRELALPLSLMDVRKLATHVQS